MSKMRLEAFSDGVFAIVITLLILDVRLPSGASPTAEAIRSLAPRIAAFVLSFIIVGVYWVAHHHMLHFVRQVNRQLLWLNLLLLLAVVFIPFPASLLGLQLRNPLVVRLYGLTLMATNAAGLLFWIYATGHEHLVIPELSREFAGFVRRLHGSPIAVYALAVALAGSNVWVSLTLYALVPLFFILPNPFPQRKVDALSGGG
jgi:TMEM175 potassium channel family protein